MGEVHAADHVCCLDCGAWRPRLDHGKCLRTQAYTQNATVEQESMSGVPAADKSGMWELRAFCLAEGGGRQLHEGTGSPCTPDKDICMLTAAEDAFGQHGPAEACLPSRGAAQSPQTYSCSQLLTHPILLMLRPGVQVLSAAAGGWEGVCRPGPWQAHP